MKHPTSPTEAGPSVQGRLPGASLVGVHFRHPEPTGSARGSRPFELRVDRLELARGEAVACIGPSGSGKTTLLFLAAGIHVPLSGEVRLAGTRIDRMSDSERRAERARNVGLVFQELELLDYLDAEDNILLPLRISGAPRAALDAARSRAAGLAASLGIDDLLRRRPARLSQGERQRVAIARALVTEPPLVLCDEPTGNLDPRTAGSVLDLLLDEARRRNAALMMVTHDHTLLGRFDRVIDVRELGGGAP